MPATEEASHVFGRFELRPGQRQLVGDGQPIAIGARAFDVLVALVERRDRTVSASQMLDIVWPGLVVEDSNVQVQISALRKILGPHAISTSPGRGYRFTAALEGGRPPGIAAGAEPAASHAGRLTARAPELVGREADLRALLALLARCRCVTIIGAGGMGKTSLAFAAAAALQGVYRDGAWIAELAPVQDARLVPRAVAASLRIALGESAPALEQLVDALADKELLLLIDNCEHLADAAAALATAIHAGAPGVRLLMTSQALLHAEGEAVFDLGPLSVPASDDSAHAGQFSAVQLFVERARQVQAGFALTPANATVVAEICRRLDGMPLAIHLAAARVRVLGVSGLLEKLDDRFKVLVGGSRIGTLRHQTLEATIAWSHDLLSAGERRVLRRLAVFPGGFTLELAQQVASDDPSQEWAVLDELGALVDKSLVVADATDTPRFHLLDSTRAFALARLVEAGEAAPTSHRHAHAVAALFARIEDERWGESGTATQVAVMARLAPELDNLRAALKWALERDNPIALALVGASAELLTWLGDCGEGLAGVRALRRHVDVAPDPLTRALFRSAIGLLGDVGVEALEASRLAVEAYRAPGQHRRLVAGLNRVGRALLAAGRVDEADAVLAELQQLREATDPAWLGARGTHLRATLLLVTGRFQEAELLLDDQRELLALLQGEPTSLVDCRNHLCATLNCLGRHEQVILLANSIRRAAESQHDTNLGYMELQLIHAQTMLGRLDEAAESVRRALPGQRRNDTMAFGCAHFALLLAAREQYANAARLDGASLAHMQRRGVTEAPVRRIAREHLLARMSAAGIDAVSLARWRAEGATLDEDAIAALCLSA